MLDFYEGYLRKYVVVCCVCACVRACVRVYMKILSTGSFKMPLPFHLSIVQKP